MLIVEKITRVNVEKENEKKDVPSFSKVNVEKSGCTFVF